MKTKKQVKKKFQKNAAMDGRADKSVGTCS